MSNSIEPKLKNVASGTIPIKKFFLVYDTLSEFHRGGSRFTLTGLKLHIVDQKFHGKVNISGELKEAQVKELVNFLLQLRPWTENQLTGETFLPDSTFVDLTIRVDNQQIALRRPYEQKNSLTKIEALLETLRTSITGMKEDRSDLTRPFVCRSCNQTLQIPTYNATLFEEAQKEIGKSVNYRVELDLSEFCSNCKKRWKNVPLEEVGINKEFKTENIALGICTNDRKFCCRMRTSHYNVPIIVRMLSHELDAVYLDPRSDELQYATGDIRGAIAESSLRKWYRAFRKKTKGSQIPFTKPTVEPKSLDFGTIPFGPGVRETVRFINPASSKEPIVFSVDVIHALPHVNQLGVPLSKFAAGNYAFDLSGIKLLPEKVSSGGAKASPSFAVPPSVTIEVPLVVYLFAPKSRNQKHKSAGRSHIDAKVSLRNAKQQLIETFVLRISYIGPSGIIDGEEE